MLKRLQQLFLTLTGRIEADPTPVGRYFLLFLAILALRLTLEFFSSHRLFSLADVLHIGLWFAMIVQAFLLQLHWFSGESITKVTRLSVVGFTIALTAPIIDLLISGGKGAKMNYLAINDWHDVLWAYLTAGGSSLTRGATLGIRIEIGLLVLASANYIYLKRQRLLPAILGAWSIYTVLFISGTIPKLLGLLVDGFGLTYGPEDQSTLLLLLTMDLILLFLAFWRHAPRIMISSLRQLPFGILALGAALFGLGALLAHQQYPANWTLNPTTLFHFPLLVGIMVAIGMLLAMLKQASYPPALRNGTGLLILIMGLAISERVLFGVAGLWGVIFLFGEAPLRLGKIILLRQVMLAAGLGISALMGFMLMGGPMVGFPATTLLTLLGTVALISLGLEVRLPTQAKPFWWSAPLHLPNVFHHAALLLGLSLPVLHFVQLNAQPSVLFSLAGGAVCSYAAFLWGRLPFFFIEILLALSYLTAAALYANA